MPELFGRDRVSLGTPPFRNGKLVARHHQYGHEMLLLGPTAVFFCILTAEQVRRVAAKVVRKASTAPWQTACDRLAKQKKADLCTGDPDFREVGRDVNDLWL